MVALTVTSEPPHVELAEAPDPTPGSDEALVRVRSFSLNRGEVLDLATGEPGRLVGWDVAGEIEQAAPDGGGPPAGARVFGLVRRGAWAERVAVPTRQLAVTPEHVSDAAAATLPTAGLTALRSLELGGLLVARRVLVTGATGGVGQYAVQLAALAGAVVTALVRDAQKSGGDLRRLGATHVTSAIEKEFDLIIDAVGGDTFGAAVEHVAAHGEVVNLATGHADEVVSFRAARFDRAAGARIHTFNLLDDVARAAPNTDLARLAHLTAEGKLVASVGLEASWAEVGRAIEALLTRAISGKAVLHIDPPS